MISRSQIKRLGKRLEAATEPSPDDLTALHDLLLAHGEALDEAVSRVRDAGVGAPTSRLKNTGTILEKLRRHGGSSLQGLQDLAGMRLVGDFDRDGQDAVVARLVNLFANGLRPPRVVDRRAEPSHGYRAVHVVVFVPDLPVEIQVRTEPQHEWAELFEKLADQVGRGIRYGHPPNPWLGHVGVAEASPVIQRLDAHVGAMRAKAIDIAMICADLLAIAEAAPLRDPSGAPLPRRSVGRQLATLRAIIGGLTVAEDEWRAQASAERRMDS